MALFSGMGKDIVYLPMYCMDGEMVVAADPVLVQKDGKVRILYPEDTREEMVTTQYTGVLAYPLNRYNNGIITGTVLKGGKVYGRWGDTLCVFPEQIELNSQRLQVQSKDSVRYVRMMLPTKGMALGDLKFYKKTASGEESLKNVRWLTELPLSYKEESADCVLDVYSSTGYRMDLDEKYADLDLGECCRLAEVSFCPYLDVEYREMRLTNFACGRMVGKSLRALKEGRFCVLRISPKCIVADPSCFAKWAETCTSFCV